MSHHCEDEHHDHHHHDAPIPTTAGQSLYDQIDTSKVKCLNAVPKGTDSISESFLKTQEEKFVIRRYLESDADCQLIVQIPFLNTCKLYSVILRTNNTHRGYTTPRTIKIFNNFKKNLDFDTLGSETKIGFQAEHPNNVGVNTNGNDTSEEDNFVEYHLPRNQFTGCETLTLFIQDNWDDEDDLTQLFYLEVRGEATGKLRPDNAVPLMTVYESAPNPLDHAKLEHEITDTLGMGS
ncbi:hypothetical protein RNJ44_03127 [Nakaseomyces bracarensis]|uniref:PITH domain-containing protein n=1 Tax=Nakaseomyces bracarensis TaxID=273131 RepID=A0ABR4NZ35_9SACH